MHKLIVSALIACGALAQTGCAITSGQSSTGQ